MNPITADSMIPCNLPAAIIILCISIILLYFARVIPSRKPHLHPVPDDKTHNLIIDNIEEFIQQQYNKCAVESRHGNPAHTANWLNNAVSFVMRHYLPTQEAKIASNLNELIAQSLNLGHIQSNINSTTKSSNPSTKFDSRDHKFTSRYGTSLVGERFTPLIQPKRTSIDSVRFKGTPRLNSWEIPARPTQQGVHFRTVKLGHCWPSLESVVAGVEAGCCGGVSDKLTVLPTDPVEPADRLAYDFTISLQTSEAFCVEGDANVPVEGIVGLPVGFNLTRLCFRGTVSLDVLPSRDTHGPLTFAVRLAGTPAFDLSLDTTIGSTCVLRKNATVEALVRSSVRKVLSEKCVDPFVYVYA